MRIAVTMGDPAGVGPELCARLLADPTIRSLATPLVFGDHAVVAEAARRLGIAPPDRAGSIAEFSDDPGSATAPGIVDHGQIAPGDFVVGQVSTECGRASYAYLESAIDLAIAGKVDAIVTAPIHKESWARAGVLQPGHTEVLAEQTRAKRHCMMLTSPRITCSLVTAHVGIRDVPGLLNPSAVLDAIELTAEAMRRIRGRGPRLVVCGLNPHAGEHGLFGGREEERAIVPAITEARDRGIAIEGPVPPDTAFLPDRLARTDAYICMYHDQGLVPLKMLAFDEAVNVTLGLPIVRTSADHGTAFDIAWTGQASPNSLLEAFRLAVRLANGPRRSPD